MNNQGKSDDDLNRWLEEMPEIDGIRPIDRIPARVLADAQRPTYKRQHPPDVIPAMQTQQDIISLVREAGGLRWRVGAAPSMSAQRRGSARTALSSGEIVKQYAFEKLPISKVYDMLIELDTKLTPNACYKEANRNGLRRLHNGTLIPFTDPRLVAKKRVLLFIHGTFSSSESLIDNGLMKTTEGAKLLDDAQHQYDLVLAYDHPTLSVSPMLNAFDLAALLRPSPATLDLVCHSRGGLVARWFCEAYADAALKRRVLFIGSPLGGTSLAAAPRLRNTLDLLTNIAYVLHTPSDIPAANPLFLAASGLLRVVGAVTGFAAKSPILDAAIALVPGLDSQAPIGNNEELRHLRANNGNNRFDSGHIQYFAVQANFEPRAMEWNFLRWFSKPLQRMGDRSAEIIFESRNDLVVDTASMAQVSDSYNVKIAYDFGTTDTVHHTNYFAQSATANALRKSFSIS